MNGRYIAKTLADYPTLRSTGIISAVVVQEFLTEQDPGEGYRLLPPTQFTGGWMFIWEWQPSDGKHD
jgi:hypothetical protein